MTSGLREGFPPATGGKSLPRLLVCFGGGDRGQIAKDERY
jgi:hypothetical protein